MTAFPETLLCESAPDELRVLRVSGTRPMLVLFDDWFAVVTAEDGAAAAKTSGTEAGCEDAEECDASIEASLRDADELRDVELTSAR